MPTPQYPTTDIRNIGLGSGDPGAYADLNQGQSRMFGLALMDLLKQYQGLEKYPFKQQEFGAREQQIRRLSFTDPSLIGASPSVQSGVRNDSVQALNPTIQGAQKSGQTFASQLDKFPVILDQAQNILKEQASQYDKQRDDARSIISQAITNFGSNAFDIVDPKYWKLAGYADDAKNKAKDTLKERELQMKLEKQQANAAMGGLSRAQTEQSVRQVWGQFDSEQIVKDYNAAQAQAQTMRNIGANSKSPADDITFVYAFAKIMDPNSVVREGEYNTIQKFAQSYLTKKELEAIRLVKNTNFLSADAKQKMLSAVNAKTKVMEDQYKSLANQYQNQVNDIYAGKPRTITDYSAPFANQTIKVRRKSDGRTGSIPEAEFDPKLYDKI